MPVNLIVPFWFQYLDIFLTRVDGIRRRILSGSEAEGVLEFSLIRETMQVSVSVVYLTI